MNYNYYNQALLIILIEFCTNIIFLTKCHFLCIIYKTVYKTRNLSMFPRCKGEKGVGFNTRICSISRGDPTSKHASSRKVLQYISPL